MESLKYLKEKINDSDSDEEEFNDNDSDEEEFKKLEELDKRFKSLESIKYLKEKINDNDSDDSDDSDDSEYLKKISSNNPQIRVDALRKKLNSKINDDIESYLKKTYKIREKNQKN